MHHCVLSQRPVIMEQRSVLPSGSPQGNREAGRPASARVYRVQKLSDTRRRGGMQKREDESLPSLYAGHVHALGGASPLRCRKP